MCGYAKRLIFSACSALLIVCLCGVSYAGDYRQGPYCKPAPPARPVQRTFDVNVSVPTPAPAVRVVPSPCGPVVQACAARPVRTPVRVNVTLSPGVPDNARPVPVAYRSPGPVKPIISNAVRLAGAVIAAPFLLADMFVPACGPDVCCPGARPEPRPMCGPPPCRPNIPATPCYPPMARPCAAPPCPPPCAPRIVKCAPPGPSVAPLPRPACAPQCGPYAPPCLVEEAEMPILEARSLACGLMTLPGRLAQRARLFGDMRRADSCARPAPRACPPVYSGAPYPRY